MPDTAPDTRIVVLPRGWVVVGDYARDGDTITISRASVIRYWGTTKGLGEIAANGPTSKTKLDKAGTLTCFVCAVVMTLACDAAKWSAAL